MSFKYKLIAAAACAAFAFPAAAQDAAAETEGKPEAGAASGQAAAGAEAEAAPAPEAEAQASGEPAAAVTAATAADVRTGATVQDPQGGIVGTIEAVDAEGAVVSTGNARAKMPISSFGKNANGLVISMTRAELEAAVSARTGS
jgi:hypothetical protein